MPIAHTPELAAARQLLFACADHATVTGRCLLFRAIAHLTGQPLALIVRTWEATR